ncbi:MAG: NADP-dependent oxidoreductase, partial [Pseudomonadales bacterium]
AGQIARIQGCRVVGIAGSAEKCRWLTDELGFDAAIDYKREDVSAALDTHCPDGIDIYFDNVGGETLDLCLARIRDRARVVLCGGISRYNATGELAGPKNYFNLVFRRARMEGFIVLDYAARFPEAARQMREWMREGRLRQRVTVVEGFQELPRALIRLFEGYNIGKLMVKTH